MEGGGFLSQKFMGIPAWIFLAGAAVLAYLYFSHQNQAPANMTTGGGGSVRTGNVKVEKGAVRINVNGSGADVDNPQPKPPHGGKGYTGPWKAITVTQDESLTDLGQSRHWSDETMGDIEAVTQPKKSSLAGKMLTADTQLTQGQTIYRPIGRGKKEQGV